MHSALPTLVPALAENGLSFVVFGTVAFSVVMSVLFLVTRGSDSMYDEIGKGGLSRESDYAGGGAAGPPPDSPAARAEAEREIRQMLTARSERLVRAGKPALDVEAELARLLADTRTGGGEHDAALVAEVRELVTARNERRARAGMEPLDVETEVSRTLAELDP